MPTIPKTHRTYSQLIESQLPEFVRDDYPLFVAFLQAYYEWLETNGVELFSCKIVNSDWQTAILTNTASVTLNAYQGKTIVALNGPAKGNTQKIQSYDPSTFTVTLSQPWGKIPPPNTLISIRDGIFPGILLDYKDIDKTLDRFVTYFRDEFMYAIPKNILADPRYVLKHIKEFYQARGTENSFRFLFRILYNEEVEIYYPKVDVLRISDANWYVQSVMFVTTSGNTFNYVSRQVTGVYSGATASVESATQQYIGGLVVTEFTLSNIVRQFQIDPSTSQPELVQITYVVEPPAQSDLGAFTDLLEPETLIEWEQPYRLLQSLAITDQGNNYQVGDTITISGGGCIAPASGIVSATFETYYTGSCTAINPTYHLESYFGPGAINASGNVLEDEVCIPGLYFFGDVYSPSTTIVNPTEIALAPTAVPEGFFVGDALALTGGTGTGQRRTILSYNATTNVATVNQPFSPVPDTTTQYCLTHSAGGIKAVQITNFGLGFANDDLAWSTVSSADWGELSPSEWAILIASGPTVTITSLEGTGAVLTPALGLVSQMPGRWTGGLPGGKGDAPTSTDSLLDSNKVIQDSYYWQDFSYDLRFGETINSYRDVVKKLVHPAGMMMFGSVLIKSQPKTGFLETLQLYIRDLGTRFFNNTPTVTDNPRLDISTSTPVVLGTTNEDLDKMKFWAFPPNVYWNVVYPVPNQTYWTPNGPGNTQIANFENIVTGSIIDNPDRRTKINPDTDMAINILADPLVGPVGPSLATVAQFKFFGFPPFQGFDEQYPSPNQNYWTSQFGNTQIKSFQNVLLTNLINSPETVHANFCVDSDVVFYESGIPSIGNIAEYAFLEGMNSQIVYNVAPNNNDSYDGTIGSDILIDSQDASWVSAGVELSSSQTQIINSGGIPVSLGQCSVIVVAMLPDVSANMSIVNCIENTTDNGFSIDLLASGGIAFRAQNGGVSRIVSFPADTITAGDYFMAALRFDNGLLKGSINDGVTNSARFGSYPTVPFLADFAGVNWNAVTSSEWLDLTPIQWAILDQTVESTLIWSVLSGTQWADLTSADWAALNSEANGAQGWRFGRPSADYLTPAINSPLFERALFGRNLFQKSGSSMTTSSVGYFDGTLAYAIFYDRSLYDWEINFIYDYLQTSLAARGIAVGILYTYYIDPVSGNDGNNGTDANTAWKTTTQADTITLTGDQQVGYKYNNAWVLYRKLNMTLDELVLPLNLINYPLSDI